MDESELDAIRKARLQEIQGQGQGQAQGQGGASSGSQSQGQGQGKDGQKDENSEEEMRAHMMSQILTPQARERLSRIRIVKGDKARGVEDMLIRMARSNQIRQKISDNELTGLLDQISQQEGPSRPKVMFSNRRTDDDDEDDLGGPTSSSKKEKEKDEGDGDDSEDDFFD